MKNQKFYCRAYKSREFWGYVKAPTEDLARECFRQNHSLPTNIDILVVEPQFIDKLSIARILHWIPDNFDPWGCTEPFLIEMIDEVQADQLSSYADVEMSNDQLKKRRVDPMWHAARIRWLLEHPENLEDPISMDCVCNYGAIYPVPEIVDGWHRFFAYRYLGKRKIPAFFSGRVDLLDYLRLRTNQPPVE